MAPSYLLLYVRNPLNSADFYSRLFGFPPVERAETFCLFVFENGLKLGLWADGDVQPTPTGTAGGAELCLTVDSQDEVRARRDAWSTVGALIVQEPTAMDFGFTFTAADPDGHRLRVFAPTR